MVAHSRHASGFRCRAIEVTKQGQGFAPRVEPGGRLRTHQGALPLERFTWRGWISKAGMTEQTPPTPVIATKASLSRG